jgi:hypothetical protein
MAHFGPLWLQQGSYPAGSDRRLIAALWPNGGVTGMAVSPGGSGMSLSVAPGSCAVPTPNNTGSTLCGTDTVDSSASCPAAPASGLNRYDVVTVLPRGNDLDGGANNDWILNVISGTAVASPTVPAVPAGQLALAQIYVPGGSASVSAGNITDMRGMQMAVPGLVAARAVINDTGAPSVPVVALSMAAATFDTVTAMTSTGYTVKVPGFYQVNYTIYARSLLAAAQPVVGIYKNGSAWSQAALTAPSPGGNIMLGAADLVQAVRGDLIQIYGGNISQGAMGGQGYSFFSINRIGG